LLKPFQQRHIDVTSFRLTKSFLLDPFCSHALIIFFLFFQIVCIIEFMKSNSHTWWLPSFSIFYFSNHFNLFFNAQTVCWWLQPCYHFTTLLLSAGVEKYRATLHTKWVTVINVTFQAWKLCSYLNELKGLILEDEERLNSLNSLLLGKLYWSRRRCPYICGAKQGKKHVPYGELVCTTECVMLQPRCRTNGVQL